MPKFTEAEIVADSFRHAIGVKEMFDKYGRFKIRLIEIERDRKDDLGFRVREGDGWSIKTGLFVSRVTWNSVFDVCKVISVGDEIVQLNDENIAGQHVGNIIRSIYTMEKFKIAVKIMTPFIKMRTNKPWRKYRGPPVSAMVDYKLMNMKINVPKKKRHIFGEIADEEAGEESSQV